jgi:RimJ/RimL family protein N-acetyltransferase
VLEGNLVRLRAYKREDLEKAREMYNDPDVNKFLRPGIPYPLRVEDEVKWYESLNPLGDGAYSFAIERISDGEYIGSCGIDAVDWKNSHAAVGIFLGKKYWDRGYGTDAFSTLIDFCFSEMNLHRIYLYVFQFNQRAIHTYEKIGFKVDGTLRENVFKNGKYQDELVMSILRNEWTHPSQT